MNEDIKTKMEGIIRNQNSNEKEVLNQLKQLIQEIESQTTVAKDSIGISVPSFSLCFILLVFIN